MMETKNKSKKKCIVTYLIWICGTFLGGITLIVLFVSIIGFFLSDFYVWNFTDSKEDVYKYVVKSRYKLRIDDDFGSVQDRIDYLYNHNDSLVFDSLLTEVLRFRTKDGCLKDYKTLWPVLIWCKEKGKKYSEIMSLKDSFLSLNHDTVWIANLYETGRENHIQPFISLIDEIVSSMVSDTLVWKDDKDVYDDITTCKMIRDGLFERLVQNGHYSTDSSSIPESVKLHQCLFSWNQWSGIVLDWKSKKLGYVLQNDTVCEIISVYAKRNDVNGRYSFCIIDRYYYGSIRQEECYCNHLWHDRMASEIEIEDPSNCIQMRDSIFSKIVSSSYVTYHRKKISHFE